MQTQRRKSEAGATLTEVVLASLLLCLILLGAGAFGGGMGAQALLNQRARIGREWADTGMAQIAARARRAPSTKPRTEAPVWTGITNYDDLGNGSLRKTGPDGWNSAASASQQFLATDAYVEWTPPANGSAITLSGTAGSNVMIFGNGNPVIGVWAAIYENGVEVAHTSGAGAALFGGHLGGDRYRIELKNRVRYWRIRSGTYTLLYESTNPLPGFPLNTIFNSQYSNTRVDNVILHGVLSDPLALPDGGTTAAGGPCVAPYCDFVWAAPRQGGQVSAPMALAPGTAPPQGSLLLFVRRFKVETKNPSWGLREISMALAETTDAQPFLTEKTEINSNQMTP